MEKVLPDQYFFVYPTSEICKQLRGFNGWSRIVYSLSRELKSDNGYGSNVSKYA